MSMLRVVGNVHRASGSGDVTRLGCRLKVCKQKVRRTHNRCPAELNQIKKDEIFIARQLDFRLMVPTALELVQHMSREICRHVPKCEESAWGGLKIMRLPQLLGPLMKNQTDEEQKKKALPARPLCMLQVVASFLVELAIVHRPGIAYGDELPMSALAVAAMQLALYSWGNEPPQSSTAKLSDLQDELGLPASQTDDSQSALTADLYRLWSNVQDTSPVLQKWKRRIFKEDPDGVLPAAPAKATLPQNLRESLDFNTPQSRQRKAQDYSATPGRMEKPEKEIGTPIKVPAPPELRGLNRQLAEQGTDQEEPPLPAQQLDNATAEAPQNSSASATWPAVGNSPAAPVPIARPEVGSSPNAATPPAAAPAPQVPSSEALALSEPTVAIVSQPAPAPPLVPPAAASSSDVPQAAPAFPEKTEKPGPTTALAPFRLPGQELPRSTDERCHEGTAAGSRCAGQRPRLLLEGRAAKLLAAAREEDSATASKTQGEDAAKKKRPLATPMQALTLAKNGARPYVGDTKVTRSMFNATGQLKEPLEVRASDQISGKVSVPVLPDGERAVGWWPGEASPKAVAVGGTARSGFNGWAMLTDFVPFASLHPLCRWPLLAHGGFADLAGMTKSIKIKMLDVWLVVVLAVVCEAAVGECDRACDPKGRQDGTAPALTEAVIGDGGDAEGSKRPDAATAWDMPADEGAVEQSHASPLCILLEPQGSAAP
ncbi:RPL18B [Symbiodinium sp. CCMP2456]|nr:RPL18B [Symbiodinium sp. CCMP2456]